MSITDVIDDTSHIPAELLPAMEALGDDVTCGCPVALAGAIITRPDVIPAAKVEQLRLLIEKYV